MAQSSRWPHPACLDDEALLKQCTVGRGRSGGPGGQHRNKVETEITLTHKPTGIIAQAGERRSQIENKQVATRRLRLLLATNHRVPPPPAPRMLDKILGPSGSALWQSRRRSGKIICNPDHHDYPALLAEALDVVADSDYEAPRAAERLEISTSQLVKLVKDHPPALVAWNAARKDRGSHPLR
jgi:hypothetical protein